MKMLFVMASHMLGFVGACIVSFVMMAMFVPGDAAHVMLMLVLSIGVGAATVFVANLARQAGDSSSANANPLVSMVAGFALCFFLRDGHVSAWILMSATAAFVAVSVALHLLELRRVNTPLTGGLRYA